ncbi:Protein glutamine dumper 3 [Apostasia shenzhenica]|uniref:Protein glutamine dumper 3 n=1 Tax=Apostasia shenzhenica TaxID=1088818 RepID=A0A2I0A741_9ASPA|nr:Protein glutamine dumper 3 [Apostasia shenzhenica]
MRPGATFTGAEAPAPPANKASIAIHSAWHSPVPYLFGGLAAMLGLVAFALLILACSYWKLSGDLDGGDDGALSSGEESGKTDGAGRGPPPPPLYDERVVVIMAGDKKPTFLATPMSGRASSFGDNDEKLNEVAAGGGAGDEGKPQTWDNGELQNDTG